MANRFHTDNSQRKISGSTPPKPSRSGTKPMPSAEKTANWKMSIGPTRPNPNKVGYPYVKCAVAKKH